MIENFKIFADFPRKGRIYHVYILQYLLSRIMMIVMYQAKDFCRNNHIKEINLAFCKIDDI